MKKRLVVPVQVPPAPRQPPHHWSLSQAHHLLILRQAHRLLILRWNQPAFLASLPPTLLWWMKSTMRYVGGAVAAVATTSSRLTSTRSTRFGAALTQSWTGGRSRIIVPFGVSPNFQNAMKSPLPQLRTSARASVHGYAPGMNCVMDAPRGLAAALTVN